MAGIETESTHVGTAMADLVITNAKVVTVDSNFSIKKAVAVKKGRILRVGTDAEIEPLIGKGTKVLNLGGKCILPGINDSHGHAVWLAATNPPLALNLRYPAVSSIREAAALLEQEVKKSKPGDWIWGFGWDYGSLEECKANPARMPNKSDLDPVSPDNPVLFVDFSCHAVWANSKAMELSGVTKEAPDPDGGVVEREPGTREPAGLFKELPAEALIMKAAPRMTAEETKKAIMQVMEMLGREGITSAIESALGPGGNSMFRGLLGERVMDAYTELCREGLLTARFSILLLFGDYGAVSMDDFKRGLDSFQMPGNIDEKWLRFPGIKVFADGIPPNKTGWLNEEYEKESGGGHGSLVLAGRDDQEKIRALKEMIVASHEKGFQVGVHATGDRAIEVTIDGFVEALRKRPSINPRHYVVHGEMISQSDLERAAEHRIGINMQPAILPIIAEAQDHLIGERRSTWDWPFRAAVESGVRLTFSSDMPVTYPNWREGVQAAVLREAVRTGKVYGPEQRLSREDAIRAYTINGAWQDLMDDVKGSIEPGKLADFCVLGDDILTVDAHDIGKIPVLMTIVDGKIVYDASGGAFEREHG